MVERAARLEATIENLNKVGLDTQPFIYHFQERTGYIDLTRKLFGAIEKGTLNASTSTITLMELLIKPFRDGDSEAVEKYVFVLRTFPNLKLTPLDDRVARRAAEIRAKYNLRTPDAIQIASALEDGAEAFFTNDRRLRKVRDIDVHVLDDYVH